KMQAQVAEIELRVAHQKGELIPAAAAKADWLTAAGIYQEEAKSLMERDHFRIYVDRVYARLQALNHCPPPAQPSPTTRVSSLRNITSPVESKA
ncbi:MAG: hypothetical protein NTW21_05420, partial [Verrucomicrobia bacterium]|nr:hypothetical protein [Verrucomicrobiota bacterium]